MPILKTFTNRFYIHWRSPCTSHTYTIVVILLLKIWALCVSQICMVYIFTCLFSVRNTINLSRQEPCLIRPNDGRIISQKSININKHAFHDMINLLYIYINIVLKSFLSKTKFNCIKKMAIFFILTGSKNIKIQKIKFEVGFSYKDWI